MSIKETQHVEFKSSFNEEVIETLSAFANTKGGRVLVGIDDGGNPTGNFTVGKESIQKWINEVKTKTKPSLIPDVLIVNINGHETVEFSMQEFPIKPVACKGKYFKRVNNSNHQMDLNEIINLHIKTFNSSWDYYPDPNHSILDISEDKVLKLIALFNRDRMIPIEKNVFEFLTKMELIRDNSLTNAGFLLLMKNDSTVSDIELGHFQNEITIKDGISIFTDLITEVEEVMSFVRKHISKEFIITANPARIERWDYPLDAIREIVLNMIVHRDYTHHGNSSVKIFPDRIEFFNPGRLPDQISIDDLLSGTYVSECRNKQIARVFKEIEWIERYGTGIQRIKNYFKNYGSPEPVFENFQHGFQVTAYALIDENIENELPDETPENNDAPEKKGGRGKGRKKAHRKDDAEMSENLTTQIIIETISNNTTITLNELSVQLQVSRNAIKKHIAKLKTLGILERSGSTKNGYWNVIKQD